MSAGDRLESALGSRAAFWLVAAVALALFATTNLPWQLDDYDQAKQAFTSYEIADGGHLLYQHTPNGWVATKPPLVAWISTALYGVTRSWELAWRLPSFAAAVALVWLVARMARAAYGSAPGLIAAAAVALNLFAPRLATLVRTDMPLALTIFLLGAQIWQKLRANAPWARRDRWIAFALLTIAMLIKGPVVYAFLLPGVVVCEIVRRRCGGAGSSAWCGWWPWLASLGVFFTWVAVGIYTTPEFLELVVIREFGGRFEGTHRAQPIYYYWTHLLHKFAPWSLLMGALALSAGRLRDKLRKITPDTLWLAVWAVGGVVVMSLVPSKRVDRIFPVVPPLCLLLAAQFAGLSQTAVRARRFAIGAVVVAVLFSGGYSASKVVAGYRQGRDAYVKFGGAVRGESEKRGLRFAVIGGEDEGMLLYLRHREFDEIPNAVSDWRRGRINAVVAPEEKAARLRTLLPNATPSAIGPSGPAGSHGTRYVLLVRQERGAGLEKAARHPFTDL